MAVDPPSRIAVLGAGPIGLESALYARSLGYNVDIYERGRIADHVLRWGHVRMFSPFHMNSSSLGLAALAAQNETYQPPNDDDLLTGKQWAEQYLVPLSQTDLLVDSIHQLNVVVSVGRSSWMKGDFPKYEERADSPFRILLRDQHGHERAENADIVIDTTGVFANPNWIGQGGMPATGEAGTRKLIEFGLPDLKGGDRENYLGRSTLVIGSGYSAATNVVALSNIARESPDTNITWITRREGTNGPIALIPNDRLPERDRLAREANRLADIDNSCVTHLPNTMVEAICHDAENDQFIVKLIGQHGGEQPFDRVIANVGYRPDHSLFEELQVHLCYATGGPMKLAAALLGKTSADCLDQSSCGPQALVNPEPNFYILGAKSYGRNSKFLVSTGLEQIRELFTIIGGREDLDLYSSVEHLLS